MEGINNKEKDAEIKKQIRSLKRIALAIFIIPMLIFLIVFVFLIKAGAKTYDYDERYGVFIGIGSKDIDKLKDYRTVIIDAEHFTKADIKKLKKAGKITPYVRGRCPRSRARSPRRRDRRCSCSPSWRAYCQCGS